MPVASSTGMTEGRDFGRVSFNGLSEPCAVGSIVEVVISAHSNNVEQQKGNVLVEAHSPAGRILKCPVVQRGSTYTANFTPQDVGDWQIAIFYDGEHIRGSPFLCQVYDANLVQVYGLDVGVVGQELKFNVNTSQAGKGDIKVLTYHHGRSIPCYLDRISPTFYKVKFTPDGAGQYKIHVYFNTMEVKGSPYILDIVDASSVSVYGDNLRMACVDKLATFMIHSVGSDSKDLTVTITAPSGKKKRARVTPIGDSIYQAEWKPVEAGEHYIDVRLYGQSVADSPFSCNVGDPDLVTVRNMPAKIRHDELGEPHTFEIDATVAGSGNLEIMINGGRIHCSVREIGSRLYLATFTPTQPVTHVVEMKFNGEPVKHSPWRIEVILPSESSESKTTTTTSTGAFTIPGMGNVILAPINLAQLQSGMYPGYVPNFYPQSSAGGATTTTISSEVERTTLHGSDFETPSSYSLQSPQSTPVWAEIQGKGLQQACVGKVANFEIGGAGSLKREDIDAKILCKFTKKCFKVNAQVAAHSLLASIMKEIPCQILETGRGTFVCEYIPTEVGTHRIELCLNGQRVKGSPFLVSAYSPNKVTIEPIPGGAVGRPVQFIVDASEAGKGQLEISINQGRVRNNVQMQGSGRCLVTFIPEYSGTYIIDVTFNGDLVLGCPVRVEIFDDNAPGGTSQQRFYTSTARESPVPASGSPSYQNFAAQDLSKPLSGSYTYERKEYSSSGGLAGDTHKPTGYRSTIETTTKRHDEDSSDRTIPVIPSAKLSTPPKESSTARYTYERGSSSGGVGDITMDRSLAETEGSKLMYEGVDSFRKEFSHVPPVLSTKHHPITGLSSLGTPPSTPAEEASLPSSFKWREKTVEKTITTAGDLGRYSPSAIPYSSEFDTRTSVAGSERYNEKDEIEERLAVRKSELIDSAVEDRDRKPYYRVSPEIGLSDWRSKLPPKGDDQYGGATVASYGTGAPGVPGDQSKNFTYFSTIGPRESTLMSTEIKLTNKFDDRIKPIDVPFVRRESEGAVRLIEEDASKPLLSVKTKTATPTDTVDRSVSPSYKDTPSYEKFSSPSKRQIIEPMEYHLLRKSENGQQLTEISTPKGRIDEFSSTKSAPSDLKFTSTKLPEIPSSKKFDWSSCRVDGPPSSIVRIRSSGRYEIGLFDFDKRDLNANIYQPSKTSLEYSMVETPNGLSIDFIPTEVGSHKLHLTYRDQTHPQSPFTFRVYDPDKIHIGPINDGYIGDTIQFTVDATHAGYGNLEIAVMDKDGNIVQSKVMPQEKSSAKFFVSFVPQKSGEYGAQITFNGENLKNSPFKCQVSDRRKEAGATLAAATAGLVAGVGAAVAPTTTSTSHIQESLTKTAPITPPIQYFVANNGRDFVKNVYPVNKPVSFELTSSSETLPEIMVKGVNGKAIETNTSKLDQGRYKIDFVPEVVGDHVIEIKQSNVNIPGSPFTCRVYDAKKIKVGEIKNGQLNQNVSFVVDASEAGVGNLEVAVNEGEISSTAKSLGQHRYEITFIPRQIVDHVISVKFNLETVPGSPFICQIVSANEIDAKGPGLGKVAVNRLTNFTVDTKYSSRVPPTVTIKDPNESDLLVKISAIYENNFRVEYTPQVVGSHTIDVRYNNEPIKDSPFTVKAYDAQSVKLLPVQGSVVGEPASFFIDATKAGAGNMEIIVSVENRNVPNFVKHEQNARFTVSFKPQEPKPHVISVKFNGEHIPGSPMTTTPFQPGESVAGASPVINEGLQQAFVGTPVSFFVRAKFPGAECNVVVTDPNGGAVPVRCYQQKDGNYRVECTPAVAGEHKVEIGFGDGRPEKVIFVKCFDPSELKLLSDLKSAQLNQEACYRVNRRDTGKGQLTGYFLDRASGVKHPTDVRSVSENEDEIRFVPRSLGQHELHLMLDGVETSDPVSFVVEDPGKPAARGDGLQKSLLNEPAYFVVENKKNKGDIKVDVLNPHGKSVKVAKSKKGDGVTEFSYTPTEIGYYNAIVLWNNKPMSGSPFNVTVVDPRNVILRDILPQGGDKRQLSSVTVGSKKELKFDTTTSGPGKLRCETRGPAGSVPTTSIESGAGQYTISFTPNVQGRYDLNLFLSDYSVPNGFYTCQANEIASSTRALTGTGATAAAGGILYYEADVSAKGLSITEAGRQQAALEAINKETTIASHGDSRRIERVASPQAIVPMPLAQESYGLKDTDSSKVTLTGDGFKTAKANEEAEFFIDASLAGPGSPTCMMTGQKADIPVTMTPVGNNIWRASYTPFVTGTYNLNITWDKKSVKGSPFKVNVLSSADAGKVIVNTEPLPTGVIGRDMKATIDTRRSGPGELTAQCVGPNKIAFCDLEDQKDGTYLLTIKAQEVGKHTLVVKYNGEHVSGSPFNVYFSSIPDPSKVKVNGPGIEHGILSRFKSNFVVDTQGAGAGQLTVRMRGPKGAFSVEMERDRRNKRLINCKYDPKEPGDYEIEVKWAGEHAPGSPFLVMIFDTQQELERYLDGQPVVGTPGVPPPFLPPGWVGPPPPPGAIFPPPHPPHNMMRPPPPQLALMGAEAVRFLPPMPPSASLHSPRMPFRPPPPMGPYGAVPSRRFLAQGY